MVKMIYSMFFIFFILISIFNGAHADAPEDDLIKSGGNRTDAKSAPPADLAYAPRAAYATHAAYAFEYTQTTGATKLQLLSDARVYENKVYTEANFVAPAELKTDPEETKLALQEGTLHNLTLEIKDSDFYEHGNAGRFVQLWELSALEGQGFFNNNWEGVEVDAVSKFEGIISYNFNQIYLATAAFLTYNVKHCKDENTDISLYIQAKGNLSEAQSRYSNDTDKFILSLEEEINFKESESKAHLEKLEEAKNDPASDDIIKDELAAEVESNSFDIRLLKEIIGTARSFQSQAEELQSLSYKLSQISCDPYHAISRAEAGPGRTVVQEGATFYSDPQKTAEKQFDQKAGLCETLHCAEVARNETLEDLRYQYASPYDVIAIDLNQNANDLRSRIAETKDKIAFYNEQLDAALEKKDEGDCTRDFPIGVPHRYYNSKDNQCFASECTEDGSFISNPVDISYCDSWVPVCFHDGIAYKNGFIGYSWEGEGAWIECRSYECGVDGFWIDTVVDGSHCENVTVYDEAVITQSEEALKELNTKVQQLERELQLTLDKLADQKALQKEEDAKFEAGAKEAAEAKKKAYEEEQRKKQEELAQLKAEEAKKELEQRKADLLAKKSDQRLQLESQISEQVEYIKKKKAEEEKLAKEEEAKTGTKPPRKEKSVVIKTGKYSFNELETSFTEDDVSKFALTKVIEAGRQLQEKGKTLKVEIKTVDEIKEKRYKASKTNLKLQFPSDGKEWDDERKKDLEAQLQKHYAKKFNLNADQVQVSIISVDADVAARRLLQTTETVTYDVTTTTTTETQANEIISSAEDDSITFGDITAVTTDKNTENEIIVELPSEGEQLSQTFTESGEFTVPLGIFSVDVSLEGESSDTERANLYRFTIFTEPNNLYNIYILGSQNDAKRRLLQNSCPTSATVLALDGVPIAIAPGAGSDGEGASGECNGQSDIPHDSVGVVEPTEGTGTPFALISWYNQCPLGYTELKSDFDPVLLAESSLYITNGAPELRVSFQLPNYYYSVAADYDTQCNSLPTLTPFLLNCDINYKTSINHEDECSFSLTTSTDQSEFVYRGILYISAAVDFNVGDYTLTRTVSSPLSWEVRVSRTITVDSQVEIANDYVCNVDADCNDGQDKKESEEPFNQGIDPTPETTGCCVEGSCDCGCEKEGVLTGYSGTYCQDDTSKPECQYEEVAGGSKVDIYLFYDSDCLILGSNYRDILDEITPGGTVWGQRGHQLYDNSEDPVNVNQTYVKVFTQGSTTPTILTLAELETHCFDVDDVSLTFAFQIYDSSNNIGECVATVNFILASISFADCHEFQNDATDGTLYCVADEFGDYNLQELSADEYKKLVSDLTLGQGTSKPILLPGAYYYSDNFWALDFDDLTGDYLAGNCSFVPYEPYRVIYTNTWNSWAPLSTYTNQITESVTPLATAPLADGTHVVQYETTNDVWPNTFCTIVVVYDRVKPTCYDIDFDAYYVQANGSAPNNYNYTEAAIWKPIVYFDPILDDGTAGSGFNFTGDLEDAHMSPAHPNNTQWYVGKNLTHDVYATYSFSDRAGNTQRCKWHLELHGSPCDWLTDFLPGQHPYCNDRDPKTQSCPTTVTKECSAVTVNENCVEDCGLYTPPVFTDDKGADNLDITLTYNGGLVADGSSFNWETTSQQVIYEATDYFDQTADCQFNIEIQDSTEPVVNCPPSLTGDDAICFVSYDGTSLKHNYTYTWSADEDCDFFDANSEGDFNGDQSAWVLIDYSSANSFQKTETITVTNAHGTTGSCSFTIELKDCDEPEITCADDIIKRNVEGTTTTNLDVTASANDGIVALPSNSISYSLNGSVITLPYDFPVGENVVFATVTDAYGLEKTCKTTVTILRAYDAGTFEAALTDAIVSEANDVFTVDITFLTLTQRYHSVDVTLDSGSTLTPANENSLLNSPITGAAGTSCALTSPICIEYWTYEAGFDSCDPTFHSYDLIGTVTCDAPANHGYPGEPACNDPTYIADGIGQDDEDFKFRISLAASNYCWQTIAGVTVTPDLITVHETELTTYLSNYDSTDATVNLPSEVTTFGNEDRIAGILTVVADDVLLSSVTITEATKTHYSDNGYSNQVDSDNLVTAGSPQTVDGVLVDTYTKENWAAFVYTELAVPLETVHYIKYSVTANIEYNLSSGSRRILSLDADSRQLLQENGDMTKFASTKAVMFAQSPIASISEEELNPNDAIVIIQLSECESQSELETGIQSAIVDFLRIAETRVSVSIDDLCFATVTVKQSSCDSITITELITALQNAVEDPFSDFHNNVYYEELIPNHVTVDTSVFLIEQVPEQILSSESSLLAESSTGSSKSFDWYIYAGAGVIGGAIIALIGLYITKKKSTTSVVTKSGHIRVPTAKRRYSIAELLEQTKN